jgi:hypothetical protein
MPPILCLPSLSGLGGVSGFILDDLCPGGLSHCTYRSKDLRLQQVKAALVDVEEFLGEQVHNL